MIKLLDKYIDKMRIRYLVLFKCLQFSGWKYFICLYFHKIEEKNRSCNETRTMTTTANKICYVTFLLYRFANSNRKKLLFFFNMKRAREFLFVRRRNRPAMEWNKNVVHVGMCALYTCVSTSGISWKENNKQFEIKIP